MLDRRIWNLGNMFALMLVLLSTRVVYWQMVRGDELQPVALNPLKAAAEYASMPVSGLDDSRQALEYLSGESYLFNLESLPQPVIQRTRDLLDSITRGSIYDRQGRLLAYDRENEEGERVRFYNEPSLAHVLGYTSELGTGVTGLEASYNSTLLGLNRLDARLGQLLHQPIEGSHLILTVDSHLQRAAEQALSGKAGAAIILDASSGAVLAMASMPRFDPNQVFDPAYVNGLLSQDAPGCQERQDCRAPFLNRATQGLYTPGSTWKTLTLITALDTGQVNPQTVFDFGQPVNSPEGSYYFYEVDGSIIPDYNHSEPRLTLEMAYAKSANAAFARLGYEMNPEVLVDYAGRFGFSTDEIFPIEIAYSPSQLASNVDSLFDNNYLRAVTAIGQGELQASPLNMALMVLAVLNRGDMPMPHFVQTIRHPDGQTADGPLAGSVLSGLMKPETAEQVRGMMAAVVESGSGGLARVPGLTVGGKTGTAQVGGEKAPHAWFTGYAQDGERGVVVAVLIENGGEGSQVAAPLFAQLAAEALGSLIGQPEEIIPEPTPAPVEPTLTPTVSPPPTVEPSENVVKTLEPTPTTEPQYPDVLPPDILRDPTKVDLGSGPATCPGTGEGPEGSGVFIWPSQYQALSGTDFKEGHPGIDLNAPAGSPVFAADAGLVIFAGWTGGVGYGNTILIDHGNGYKTLYAHLSQVSTFCGAKVEAAKLIGLSGNTGNSSGPHLHFEVRVPGGYINPLRVLPTP